jgi:hypothetical protein
MRDLERAAADARLSSGPTDRVVLQQIVDGAGERVSYHLVLAGGGVSAHLGDAPEPDVTFRTDYETAAAINRGLESAQAAFMRGRLQIGGDIAVLLGNAGALAELDDVFAGVRATTTY